ncbi:MAG: glycosyltransferase family 2 protein [Halothece sp. Uz-M2-17]|nr:glycosyltransferase family 2 protein [Halothece sp. Uz-M2-17]
MLYFLFVNYQSAELIKHLLQNYCLSSLAFKAVIVNNFPPEQKDLETLATDSIRVIDGGGNLGFGRACNLGLSWIYDQYPQALVWLLNPDTFCDPKMITKAQSFFKRYSTISILGTLIYSTDNNIWFAGGTFDSHNGRIASENLLKSDSQTVYSLSDWVSGCSMIINLSHFKECPQFDSNYFLYYEDFDFCQRYKQQGHLVAVTDQVSITHQVSAITNRNLKSKFYHSTYSYLLTLEKYTSSFLFYLRLIRVLIYSIVLFPFKPAIALGKITGTWHYFQQKFSGVQPPPR